LKYRPKDVAVATDIATVVKILVLYWTGLLWLYPLQHEIFGFIVMEKTKDKLPLGLIKAIKNRGRKVAVFGPLLDHKEYQQKFLEMGCDMVLTDRPDVLRQCVDELNEVRNEPLQRDNADSSASLLDEQT